MNSEDIKIILKEIKYPGYSRDIVSFGIVENIILEDLKITISLNINAEKQIISSIQNEIISSLRKAYPNHKVHISIKESTSDSNITGEIKSLDKVKNIIAIASGKGGVGKSTSTVNIASILSKKYKVGILDLDIYGPSLPTALGIHEMPKMSENNYLLPLEKFGMKLMSFGFLNTESAPTIWRGPMVSRMTQQFFEQVEWGELDFLFLDLPPGTGDIQLTLVQKVALSGAVIITTPQDLALLDVKKASDMFNQLKTPILGVVENMSNFMISGIVKDLSGNVINGTIETKNQNYKIEDGKTTLNFEIFKGIGGLDESQRLDVPLLSKIPIDSDLALCTDNGTPYVFKHKTYITECYEDIGKKIEKIVV